MLKKKTVTPGNIVLIIALVLFFVLGCIGVFFLKSVLASNADISIVSMWVLIVCALFLISFISILFLFLSYIAGKKKGENNSDMDEYERDLKSALAIDDTPDDTSERKQGSDPSEAKPNSEKEKRPATLRLMELNLKSIKKYYSWSQEQAKSTFNVAIISCVAGFVMILSALLLTIILKLNFEAALLTAIGGIITEVFGGTTLLVYRSSILQLNHYHKSLHEDQRFLSATDLISKMSSETGRDKMLEAVIRNALRINLAVALDKEILTENDKDRSTDSDVKTSNTESDTNPR